MVRYSIGGTHDARVNQTTSNPLPIYMNILWWPIHRAIYCRDEACSLKAFR